MCIRDRFGSINVPSSVSNASLDYDGSTFSANNDMNINHGGQHSNAGTVTAALLAGGGSPYAVAGQSETYDGTTFSPNATLGSPGQRGGLASTQSSAIVVGGCNPPVSNNFTATEEYNAAAPGTKTVTTS